jgi:two-component system, OmpR family, response regulator
MRILLVEDDPLIAEGLQAALRHSGTMVDAVATKSEAEGMLSTDYAVVLLDLGLPDGDGLDLLKAIRARKKPLPVIVITARDRAADRVKGLDLGADDYVVKPFELSELEARIRAVTRRSNAGTRPDLTMGPLSLLREERRVYAHGKPVDLTPREYALVELLLLRQGRVVSKSQIEEQLCEWEDALSDAAIEVLVHRLRKKIDPIPGVRLRTLRGFGYLLEESVGSGG